MKVLKFAIIAAVSVLAVNIQVLAQETIYADPMAEESVQPQSVQPVAAEIPRKAKRNSSGQQIYILNNNATPQAQPSQPSEPAYLENEIQEQPVTEVNASPYAPSKATGLRKNREGLEVETEQKIVEKLEESRIVDEKTRQQRLFGDRLAPQPAPAPTALPSGYSVPVTVQPENGTEITDTSAPSPSTQTLKRTASPRFSGFERTFLSADVGVADYPDATNIRGNHALGVGLGTDLPNRFSFEGRFKYSNYELENIPLTGPEPDPTFFDIDQYNFGLNAMYRLLPGLISPRLGGLLSYTHRTYTQDTSIEFAEESDSNAFDVGFLVGAELDVNESLAFALDYTYMTNLSYKQDGQKTSSVQRANDRLPVEEFDYSFITLSGKFYF